MRGAHPPRAVVHAPIALLQRKRAKVDAIDHVGSCSLCVVRTIPRNEDLARPWFCPRTKFTSSSGSVFRPRGFFPMSCLPGVRFSPRGLNSGFRILLLVLLIAEEGTAEGHGCFRLPSGLVIQFPQPLCSGQPDSLAPFLDPLAVRHGEPLLEVLFVPVIPTGAQLRALTSHAIFRMM